MELPHYHHKVNVRVGKQDAEEHERCLEMKKVKKSIGSSSREFNKISN